MKSTELRIGNLVNYGTGREPQSITGKDLYDGVEDRPFSPIELYPEWLERFGFVFGNNHGYYVLLQDIEKGDYDYDNVLYVLTEYEEDICKYVHQLQNLFFANMGIELQLK